MEKRLTADLNVVANSNLEIQLLDGDLNIIQKLDDEPNDVGGLTSAELKAKFDESGNIIKKYINETLIPAVLTDDATEESRKQAEAARVAAEQGRVTAEEGRVSAEAARAAAEQARSEAESSRVSAENARVQAETARADETAGIVAQATAQANAAAGSASQAAGSEQSAKDAAGTATGAASSASQSAAAASGSASQASAAAASAAQSAASVDGINKTAQSWAVGGTGTRPGEDTNNAKYWAQQAQTAVGGDFATKDEAQGYVTAHNESVDAHHDLRAAVAGSIRYDAAQSLTDAQKTQARNNISALNGQFLLAKSVGEQLGWYRITAPFSTYNTSGYLTVSHAWASGGASELLLGVSSAPDTHGKLQCLRSVGQINSVPYISNARLVQVDKRTLALDLYVSGTGKNDWNLQLCNCGDNPITLTTPTFISTDDTLPSGETLAAVMEYQNPPMLLGVEYRTTERFWGRPVYYKIVDCGQIADNKQVEHGIVNMRDCISFQGLRGGLPMPSITNNNLSDPWSYYVADVSRTKITLACGASAAGGNCYVMLKYTKTTD